MRVGGEGGKMIKIEKYIPIPDINTINRKRSTKYPFDEMEIGDSFFISCEEEDKRRIGVNIISNAGRRKPKRFTTLSVEGGMRCWRIQ